MGIDAYVQCNCIRNGMIKQPQFDLGLIEVIDGVYDINSQVSDDIYYQFRKWAETACQHPNFEFYENRIGNAWAMSNLWYMIEKVGEKNVSEICKLFQNRKLAVEQVNMALQQLKLIKKELANTYGTFLFDEETKEDYDFIIDNQRMWFYSHGGEFYYGLSKEGFYIEDENHKEVFQSMNFKQEVEVENQESKVLYQETFTDIASGKTYHSNEPIKQMIWESKTYYYPKLLNIINRTLTVDDLYSIQVLDELFQASMKMNNPVVIYD